MRQLAWRLGQRLALLIAISVCSFVLLSLAPGNFFDDLKLNPQISPATVATLQSQYGANRPLPERYMRWLQSIARGEWGYSLSYHWPPSRHATELILQGAKDPDGGYALPGYTWTAMGPANAIPAVVDAPPGFMSHNELGLMPLRGVIRP